MYLLTAAADYVWQLIPCISLFPRHAFLVLFDTGNLSLANLFFPVTIHCFMHRKVKKSVCLFCCLTSQSTTMVMSRQPVNLYIFPGQAEKNQGLVHILSPVTDNCPT